MVINEVIIDCHSPSLLVTSTSPERRPLPHRLKVHLLTVTAHFYLAPPSKRPFIITYLPSKFPLFSLIYTVFDFTLHLLLYVLGPHSALQSALAYSLCERTQVWRFWTYSYQWIPLHWIILLTAGKFYLASSAEILNGRAMTILVLYIGTVFGSLGPGTIFTEPDVRIWGLGGGAALLGLALANWCMNSAVSTWAPLPLGTSISLLLYSFYFIIWVPYPLIGLDSYLASDLASVLGGLLAGLIHLGPNEPNFCCFCGQRFSVARSIGRIATLILIVIFVWFLTAHKTILSVQVKTSCKAQVEEFGPHWLNAI